MHNISTPDLLTNARDERRLMHLEIDNQPIFPIIHFSFNAQPQQIEPFVDACRDNARFTDKLAGAVPTCHVFLSNNAKASAYYQATYKDLEPHCAKVFYDKSHLKAHREEPTGGKVSKTHLITMDDAYLDHNVLIKDADSAFDDGRLAKFLNENKQDVLLFSGLYLEACIDQSMADARSSGFEPVLITDRTLGYSDFAFNSSNLTEKSRQRAQKHAEDRGIRTIESNQLLNLMSI